MFSAASICTAAPSSWTALRAQEPPRRSGSACLWRRSEAGGIEARLNFRCCLLHRSGQPGVHSQPCFARLGSKVRTQRLIQRPKQSLAHCFVMLLFDTVLDLSLIHISEPTRL